MGEGREEKRVRRKEWGEGEGGREVEAGGSCEPALRSDIHRFCRVLLVTQTAWLRVRKDHAGCESQETGPRGLYRVRGVRWGAGCPRGTAVLRPHRRRGQTHVSFRHWSGQGPSTNAVECRSHLPGQGDTPEAQLFLLLWELPEDSVSKGKGHQAGNEASLRPLPCTPSMSWDKPLSLSRPLLPHLQKTV